MALPSALLTGPAQAAAVRQGMNLSLLTAAQVSELNALWTPATLAAEQGVRQASAQAGAAELAAAKLQRPAPSSQPSDIADFLNGPIGRYWGPVQLYPEFGWRLTTHEAPSGPVGFNLAETLFPVGTSLAAYDMGPGDHVSWNVTPSGQWSYEHTWGGFDLGRTLESIASAVAIVGAAFGIVGLGQFVYLLNAAAGNGLPAELGSALKGDYDNFSSAEDLAKAVAAGDWSSAWNQVTARGTDLLALQNAFSPGPAPDIHGDLTVAAAPSTAASSSSSSSGDASAAVAAARQAGLLADTRLAAFSAVTERIAATPTAPAAAASSPPWSTTKKVGAAAAALAGLWALQRYVF